MGVYIRILLWIVTGALLSSGWITEELRARVLNDPQAAEYAQMVLSGFVAGITWFWWRLAKRWGLST